MPISTQDIEKGLDLTGLAVVGGTQINQQVDAANPSATIGFNLTTNDTALNTPQVPDASVTTKWKRYIWRRNLFDNTVKLYVWIDAVISDATFKKWIEINANVASLSADVATALANAATANTNANNAVATANTAQGIAQTALDTATAALVESDGNTTSITNLQSAVNNGVYQSGDLRYSIVTTIYSTAVDQGWLVPDGGAVSRTVFATLFSKIGTTFGNGDGVNTFNLPDLRGRFALTAGHGVGLTDRAAGTTGGEENHVLIQTELPLSLLGITEVRSGYRTNLNIGGPQWLAPDGSAGGSITTPPTETASHDFTNPGGDQGHNNMPPFMVLNVYIKT
jgi:microcystin-dependent protein